MDWPTTPMTTPRFVQPSTPPPAPPLEVVEYEEVVEQQEQHNEDNDDDDTDGEEEENEDEDDDDEDEENESPKRKRKRRLHLLSHFPSSDKAKLAYVNESRSLASTDGCAVCGSFIRSDVKKSTVDRNDMLPTSAFSDSNMPIENGKDILAHMLGDVYEKSTDSVAYCLRCCQLVICSKCMVEWACTYGAKVSEKPHSSRVLPRCACCTTFAGWDGDVVLASNVKCKSRKGVVTTRPLFCLTDLITNGSITLRFISVLNRYHKRKTSRYAHTSNYLIRNCVGDLLVI